MTLPTGKRCAASTHGSRALAWSERDTAFRCVYAENHSLYIVAGLDDILRLANFTRPRHRGNVDQALNARFKLEECSKVGDTRNHTTDTFRRPCICRVRRPMAVVEAASSPARRVASRGRSSARVPRPGRRQRRRRKDASRDSTTSAAARRFRPDRQTLRSRRRYEPCRGRCRLHSTRNSGAPVRCAALLPEWAAQEDRGKEAVFKVP